VGRLRLPRSAPAAKAVFPGFVLPCAFPRRLGGPADRKGASRPSSNSFRRSGVLLANVPWMIASLSRLDGGVEVPRPPAFRTLARRGYWLAQAGDTYVRPVQGGGTGVSGGWGGLVGTGGLALFGLASLLILWVGWRRPEMKPGGYPVVPHRPGDHRLPSWSCPKVHSPQYALWVMPLIANGWTSPGGRSSPTSPAMRCSSSRAGGGTRSRTPSSHPAPMAEKIFVPGPCVRPLHRA